MRTLAVAPAVAAITAVAVIAAGGRDAGPDVSLHQDAGDVVLASTGATQVATSPMQSGKAETEGPRRLLEQVELLADSISRSTGFDWRAHEIAFRIGCPPEADVCPAAAYLPDSNTILVAADQRPGGQLVYVVMHELAHAWQFNVRGWPAAADDMSAWGRVGIDGAEAAADCLVAAWGWDDTHHWDCPDRAREHMSTLYQKHR